MRAGAPHGGEIAYVFGTLAAGRGGAPTPEDLAVSRMAQSYWVNFAKTGDPNGSGPANLAAPRRRQGPNLRFPARWHRGRRARSPESTA